VQVLEGEARILNAPRGMKLFELLRTRQPQPIDRFIQSEVMKHRTKRMTRVSVEVEFSIFYTSLET